MAQFSIILALLLSVTPRYLVTVRGLGYKFEP